jgi:hypothetical protein
MSGWHLDKRVSISHILTTLTVTTGILLYLFEMDNRVSIAEFRIDQIQVDDAATKDHIRAQFERFRADRDLQYANIRVQLARIEQKLDEHKDLHIEELQND